MSDFEREERYIVIKRKHLDKESEAVLRGTIQGLNLPTQECVVVEPDWPNYAATWRSVQQVAEGTYDPDEITRLQSEVERLRGRCEKADSRICRQHEYLKSLVSICTKQAKLLDSSVDPLVDLTERFLRSGEIDSGEHRSYVLRKQAEAVEFVLDKLVEDQPCVSANVTGVINYYAQRLRQQAAESEDGAITRKTD